MGNCCHPFGIRRKVSKRNIVLLLVGLDNAGKTTAAKSLIGESQDGVVPTVGFSAVNLAYKHSAVTVYDLGGGPQIRGIWHQYFVDVHGIIFVIDASDISRLEEGRKILEGLLSHEKLAGKPMLLLANKQDCKEALDELDIVEQLNIETLVNFHRCPTLVETCSALKTKSSQQKVDPAIHNGFKWLINCINKDYERLNARVEADTREQRIAEEQKRKERLQRIRKAQEERGGESESCQADADGDSDSDDVIASDPFRPISEIMDGLNGAREIVAEPELNNSRIILVKESPRKHMVKDDMPAQERVPPLPKKDGSGDSTTQNVTQLVKDQLQLDVLPHKKHIPLLPHRNNRTAPAPISENVPLKDITAIEAMFEVRKNWQHSGNTVIYRKQAFVEEKRISGSTDLESKHFSDQVDIAEHSMHRKCSGVMLKELPPSLSIATENESTKRFCIPVDLTKLDTEESNQEVIEVYRHDSISLPISQKGSEQEKQKNTRRVVSAEVPQLNKLESNKTFFSKKSSLDESSLSSESRSIFNDSGFASPWRVLPPLHPPSSEDKPHWICPPLSSIQQRPSSPGSELEPERRDNVPSLLEKDSSTTNKSDIFT